MTYGVVLLSQSNFNICMYRLICRSDKSNVPAVLVQRLDTLTQPWRRVWLSALAVLAWASGHEMPQYLGR